ncbi:MAG: hypothetical protein M3T56_12605 [Chloroflexota bacterium]|nr:hypothetical protein [Chloroflexota bacterium]
MSLGIARLVFASLLVVYVVAGVWTTRRVNATGDEPFYFMATDALLHGEGLELTERWRELPTASYDPGEAVPLSEFERSTAPSRARAGSYPLHDTGTSFVIALPFAVGGRALVSAFVALVMATAVALGVLAARASGAGPTTAAFAGLAVGLTAPALTYSGQVFPDALAPLPLGIAVCALVGALPRSTFGPAIAALPFLHLRFWPLALALLAVYVIVFRPGRREAGLVITPLVGVVLVLSLLGGVVYGVPIPHAGFLLFFTDRPEAHLAAFTRPTGEGLVGLFVDRAFGLLPAAPLMALLAFGVGAAARRSRLAPLMFSPIPYLMLVSFLDWTGGFSPQGRYFAVLTPVAVVLLALAFESRPARLVAIPLGLWTLGQSLVYVAAPWLRYDFYGGAPLADMAWSRFVGLTPSAIFPLFGCCGTTTTLLAIAWSAVLLALVIVGAASRRPVTPASH